jgi:hypothetical protein
MRRPLNQLPWPITMAMAMRLAATARSQLADGLYPRLLLRSVEEAITMSVPLAGAVIGSDR